ncbi:MAG: DUF4349 domain-containing protein [Deltaproteobacteria bacterium]|uniref:DUF4349 domain-containing protein n=1 Tax=Candidatus Zymogenus saltonus TaxID=2844893 RepID=A0A9D8PKI3_9DELT|nr:DUF4349 domain-containing protein [Candidatus Zymogenus saltonus]
MKNNRLNILLVSILVLAFAAFSCGKSEEARFPGMGGKTKELVMEYELAEEPAEAPPAPGETVTTPETEVPNVIKRKIIKSAQITIKTKNFLKSFDTLQDMVKSEKGFIADSSSYKSDLGNMSGEITIRVPPDNFESLIKKIETLGDIESKKITGEDITKTYYDLELRLKTKEEMQRRLLDLLAKRTTNVKDLLEVERELGRILEEIESIKGTLRYYDNLLGMSTITLNLAEPSPIGPSKSAWTPLKNSIRDSLEAFSYSIRALMIFIFAVLPWLLLFLIFIVALWKSLKYLRRDKGKVKASKK